MFSGVIPMHVPLKKSKPYMLAKSLGANVQEEIIDKGPEEDRTVNFLYLFCLA